MFGCELFGCFGCWWLGFGLVLLFLWGWFGLFTWFLVFVISGVFGVWGLFVWLLRFLFVYLHFCVLFGGSGRGGLYLGFRCLCFFGVGVVVFVCLCFYYCCFADLFCLVYFGVWNFV